MTAAAISQAGETTGGPMRLKLAGFARTLRDNGFKIGLAETRDALAILTHPMTAQPRTLKPALRSLFCATRSDWERFDESAELIVLYLPNDALFAAALEHDSELLEGALASRVVLATP